MPKSRALEATEQWLGHFVGLGIVLGAILGPLAVGLYMIREFSSLKLPWPMKGQWPIGNPFEVRSPANAEVSQTVTQYDRVLDLCTDLKFTLSGYMIGQTIQIVCIVRLMQRYA